MSEINDLSWIRLLYDVQVQKIINMNYINNNLEMKIIDNADYINNLICERNYYREQIYLFKNKIKIIEKPKTNMDMLFDSMKTFDTSYRIL